MKTLIVVHCADTPESMDIGAAEIDKWHRDKGWSAIGYAFVIRRDGTIEKGRDLDNDGDSTNETGAHAAGFNAQSIGICLVGGKPGFNFTDNQMSSLRFLIDSLTTKFYGIDLIGHCDLPGVTKSCPCFDTKHWYLTNEVK